MLATAATAVAISVLAGCSSGPHAPSMAQVQRAQGAAARHALSVGRGVAAVRHLPAVRLGLMTSAAGGSGLAAQGLGYFGQQLGNRVTLEVTALGSTIQAQSQALATGRVDAAYVSPAAAVAAWHATRGRVLVVSGSAVSAPSGSPVTVLAVTSRFVSAHPGWVTALVRGQVRAGLLLDTDPAAGRAAAAAELASLAGHMAAAKAAARFAGVRFTDDPRQESVLAQAGSAGPLAGLFDLGPLNAVLRAVGLRPVKT